MRSFATALLLALAYTSAVQALYTSSDDVISVSTPEEFKRKVIDHGGPVLVEFFAPWCGHCKNLVPEWKKAATALKGIVPVVAVDADAHRNVAEPYGVQGFPTIKFFTGKTPKDYSGGRTATEIVDFALKEIKSLTQTRLGGGGGGSGAGRTKTKSSESGSGSGSGGAGTDDVVKLTAANFKELVLESQEPWLVEFFAPWCGHCKNLAPAWAAAATKLKGKVNLGAVDATVEGSLAQEYGVSGYPTIKTFAAGAKSKSSAKDYQGGRTTDAIVSYALDELHVDNTPPPAVNELVNADVYSTACGGPNLCVVSFLPDILDSGAKGRNAYISSVKEVAKQFKKNSIQYLWAAATQQSVLEQLVGVGGSGYPALVVINPKKQRMALMTSAFTDKNIATFISGLLSGKEVTSVAPALDQLKAAVTKTTPWDGKDGQVQVADEVDLSSLGLNFAAKTEL